MVNCPLCDAALDIDEDELDEGDEMTCDECGGMIRVASKTPLEMEGVVEDDDEDDDLDDDEEDEEDFEEGEEGEEDLEEEDDDGDEDWR